MSSPALAAAYARHRALAERACAFLTAATDPFHAVQAAVRRLEAAGFARLEDRGLAGQGVERGGKYFYTVHHSTLVAFTVGEKYQPGAGGFLVIGGHTDSVRFATEDGDTGGRALAC